MIQERLIGLLLFGYTLFCNCYSDPAGGGILRSSREYKAKAYGRLPKGFYESSGLIGAPGGTFWTLQDSGNPPYLYHFNAAGELLDTLALDLPNQDWESLSRDVEGNIYIGDFGNNSNRRQNLRIFRLSADGNSIDTIHFSYPGQEAFPPESRKDYNFDAEAFFWHRGALHLFSKSYGNKIVTHYILPDSAGTYKALEAEQVKLQGLITGAAIRPDGREMALLAYGRIYLFPLNSDTRFFRDEPTCISLAGRAQTEAIIYVNNANMLLTNEQGRLIYVFKK